MLHYHSTEKTTDRDTEASDRSRSVRNDGNRHHRRNDTKTMRIWHSIT
ncbi:uncharacterized protein G2W53_025543 [Senna tora]|uniref:Uncharacterized protein n=1 Tax=Senna tora TaxID=362788 RepID=A0A834TDT1_9FABA|nr:uncharacterized protein G2W53_025543 [Senna tora]